MKNVLLDTDILSYIMKKDPIVIDKYDKHLKEKGFVYISRISIIEIMGGLKSRNAYSQLEKFQELISKHQILDTTEISAFISSDIYASLIKMGKHSGNYDILIAGIAMANNLILVTNNTKDYENIEGLELQNWTLRVQ